jgi:hypothetical protein
MSAMDSVRAGLAALVLGVIVSGCKASAAPSAPKPSEHAGPTVQAAPAPAPAPAATPPREQQFELPEDEVDDPAEALHALRHNCCDEMPAAEVDAVVKKSAADTAASARKQH